MRLAVHLVFYLLTIALMLVALLTPQYLSAIPTVLMFLGLLGIFGGSVLGFASSSILRFSLFSCLAQFGYFVLDYGTAVATGKSVFYASIQTVNFAITGLLFALVLIEYQRTVKSDQVVKLSGLFNSSPVLGVALTIACLSFGGLPAFNIFVGEYLNYQLLYTLHPFYALITVFGSLLAFLFYFRLVYIIFSSAPFIQLKAGLPSKVVSGLLAGATVLLGVVPWILFKYLELVA